MRRILGVLLTAFQASVAMSGNLTYSELDGQKQLVFNELVARSRICMRDAAVARIRGGVRDEEAVRSFAIGICTGSLTTFMTQGISRPKEEVAAYLVVVYNEALRNVPGLTRGGTPGSRDAQAQPAPEKQSESERLVDSIRSAAQVKARVRDSLAAIDTCPSGSCINTNSTEICTYVGALDVRAAGAISSADQLRQEPDIRIARDDLNLFKAIWAQCKPTSYQFWNYPSVLHVAYDADEEADRQIRRALGIAKR